MNKRVKKKDAEEKMKINKMKEAEQNDKEEKMKIKMMVKKKRRRRCKEKYEKGGDEE